MKKIIWVILVTISIKSNAQLENANWCFVRNAKINFYPTISVSSSYNPSFTSGNYGGNPVTVSDQNGVLQFYSEGTTVRGSNDQILANGTGLNGSVELGAWQTGNLIIPKPQHPGVYYLFTTNSLGVLPGLPHIGVNYSVVDMNQGTGTVTLKNIPLADHNGVPLDYERNVFPTGTQIFGYRLASTMHHDGDKIWLVLFTRFNDATGPKRYAYSYLITSNGINNMADGQNPPPTMATLLDNAHFQIPDFGYDPLGRIKISPDGTKLGQAFYWDVDLYNFNNQTGGVSFNSLIYHGEFDQDNANDVEFSPNSQFLYYTRIINGWIVQSKNSGLVTQDNSKNDKKVKLDQYNITSQTTKALSTFNINSTSTENVVTPVGTGAYGGNLQLALDGKIYFGTSANSNLQWTTLGAITNPNVAGVGCNPVLNAIDLVTVPAQHAFEFPPWVQKIINCSFNVASTISGPDNACPYLSSGSGAAYSIAATGASGFTWSSTSGIILTPGSNTASATFAPGFTSGTITVVVANGCGGDPITRTISVNANLPSMPGGITGPTINYCIYVSPPYDPATYSIQPVNGASSYLWTTSSGASITPPGNTTNVEVNFTSSFPNNGTVCVQALSPACGNSAVRCTQPIKRIPASTPSPIQGPTDVCSYIQSGLSATYSVTASPNVANEYAWSVTGNATIPTNQVLNSNSIMITFLPGFTTGTISVVAINGCATSPVRNLNVSKNPPLPPPISGEDSPCGPSVVYPYSITPMAGIIDYHWDAGSIGTVITGQGTPNAGIQFTTGWTTGNVRVQTFSACGSSIRYKPVTNPNCSRTMAFENSIYPNPSNGDFSMTINNIRDVTFASVQITNQLGIVVYHDNQIISKSRLILNLHDKLGTGIYQVSCEANGKKSITKLLVIN